ncbi:MAG TPA: hypothetical protein VGD90_06570 [Sphingobacteriaceae bacterium]
MDNSYLPVSWEYKEVIAEAIERKTSGKVFYFSGEQVESAEGQVTGMEEIAGSGVFVKLTPEHSIRIDRIITLFGKPGAAYDEYDAFANACLSCQGGYRE